MMERNKRVRSKWKNIKAILLEEHKRRRQEKRKLCKIGKINEVVEVRKILGKNIKVFLKVKEVTRDKNVRCKHFFW